MIIVIDASKFVCKIILVGLLVYLLVMNYMLALFIFKLMFLIQYIISLELVWAGSLLI